MRRRGAGKRPYAKAAVEFQRKENRMQNNLFRKFDGIIVIDTETTGLDSKKDEIIELAAIKLVRNGSDYITAGEIDIFIKPSPEKKLPPRIVELTGITDHILKEDGLSKAEACEKFSELLSGGKNLIIAYNAQFDMCFLYYFLCNQNKQELLNDIKIIDALTVYKDRREYPHKLSDAVEAYSLSTQNTHRAIDDAKATLELINAMGRENADLERYINLFGYNPKYGVSGPRISSVTYVAQHYNEPLKLYEKTVT